jgi:hypothetical protein
MYGRQQMNATCKLQPIERTLTLVTLAPPFFLSFTKHFSVKLVNKSTLQANKIHVLGLARL